MPIDPSLTPNAVAGPSSTRAKVTIERLDDGHVLVFARFGDTAHVTGGVCRRLFAPTVAEIAAAVDQVEAEVAEIDAEHRREAN